MQKPKFKHKYNLVLIKELITKSVISFNSLVSYFIFLADMRPLAVVNKEFFFKYATTVIDIAHRPQRLKGSTRWQIKYKGLSYLNTKYLNKLSDLSSYRDVR